jgi:hypothetical protein
MERIKLDGYIAEKMANAHFSGTVPIWYRTREVFDVFNERAFVYYCTRLRTPISGQDHVLGEEPDCL